MLKQHQQQGEEEAAVPKGGDKSGLRALPAWLDAFLDKASKERKQLPPVPPRNAFAQQFAELQDAREQSSDLDERAPRPRANRRASSPLQDRRDGVASTAGGVAEFSVVEVVVPRDQV